MIVAQHSELEPAIRQRMQRADIGELAADKALGLDGSAQCLDAAGDLRHRRRVLRLGTARPAGPVPPRPPGARPRSRLRSGPRHRRSGSAAGESLRAAGQGRRDGRQGRPRPSARRADCGAHRRPAGSRAGQRHACAVELLGQLAPCGGRLLPALSGPARTRSFRESLQGGGHPCSVAGTTEDAPARHDIATCLMSYEYCGLLSGDLLSTKSIPRWRAGCASRRRRSFPSRPSARERLDLGEGKRLTT